MWGQLESALQEYNDILEGRAECVDILTRSSELSAGEDVGSTGECAAGIQRHLGRSSRVHRRSPIPATAKSGTKKAAQSIFTCGSQLSIASATHANHSSRRG